MPSETTRAGSLFTLPGEHSVGRFPRVAPRSARARLATPGPLLRLPLFFTVTLSCLACYTLLKIEGLCMPPFNARSRTSKLSCSHQNFESLPQNPYILNKENTFFGISINLKNTGLLSMGTPS